ncbi:MAG TPA: hypothetical protein VGF52_02680 [Tepidisphaeraceae bacterium]
MRLGLNLLIIASCLAWLGGRGFAVVMLEDMDNASECSLLSQAYSTLAKADHDYDGHRKKAMKAIEAACDALGQGIASAGKIQRQHVSDNQLRAAQRIIERVRDNALQRDQHKVVNHLVDAINEISQALDTK